MNVRFCGQADFTCRSSNHVPLWSYLWRENRKASKKAYRSRNVAEREGFEPSRRLPAYTRSRRAPSTTRPPLLQASRKEGHYSEANPLFKRTSSRSRGTASGRAYLAFWHASKFTKRQVVPISCQVMLSHVGRSAAKYTESMRAAGFERDGAIDYLVVKRQFTPLAHAVLF